MISLLEFAESYRKPNTTRNAKICVRAFLEYLYKIERGDEPVDEYYIRLDSLSIQYLSSSPDYADDLFRFAVSLKDIAPTSQKRHLSVVKNWFELNDIVIRPARLKAIHNRLPRAKPITKERDLSIDDLSLHPGDPCSHLLLFSQTDKQTGFIQRIFRYQLNYPACCKPAGSPSALNCPDL